MPVIRVQPEDFFVEETLLYPPSGRGNHTYLWVEKRLATTDGVARALARAVGVPVREIGYAGRKDRRAVTRQWFSVPELDLGRARELEVPSVRILEVERHPQRLRVGQLVGNRFELRVRQVAPEEAATASERLAEIEARGLANRFGRQRFGRHGDNVDQGLRILHSREVRGDRRHALLMIAAVQSAVFNRVLERRPFDELWQGDVALRHATGTTFLAQDPQRDAERLASFEISPTGPIFGTKMKRPRGAVAELEAAAMAELDLPSRGDLPLPRGLRLYGDRRSLRVRPREIALREADGDLVFTFTLPAGSYATVFMEELFPGGLDELRGDEDLSSDEATGDPGGEPADVLAEADEAH